MITYQMRATAATEATKRNTSILVWAFVGIPAIIGAVVAIIAIVSATSSTISESNAQSAMDKVQQVYQSVDYAPPGYTSIQGQSNGVCSHLRDGMSQSAAADAMIQGFGEGMTRAQAVPIVAAIADNLC